MWGALLVLIAALIVGSQIFSFNTINVWTIIATIMAVYILVESVLSRNFLLICLALATLYLLYITPLSLPVVSPWYLFLGAVVAGIGLTMMFRRRPAKHLRFLTHPAILKAGHLDETQPTLNVNFSTSQLTLHADAMHSGQFVIFFGALHLDLTQAELADDKAEVWVDSNFSSLKLTVPRDWRVIDNLTVMMGTANVHAEQAVVDDDSPQFILSGSVSFGSVKVEYI